MTVVTGVTTILTDSGSRTLGELENQACRVLTDDGFQNAVVTRFRKKPLVEIQFAPAFAERDRYGGMRLTTRNISRFRRVVTATPTHPWLLVDGQRADGLSVGQYVPSARRTPRRDGERYRLGALHGLVFGDGRSAERMVELLSGRHCPD